MSIPVIISSNGRGLPVRAVDDGAPVMQVASNGKGMPIVLSDRGAPFVVRGGTPAPSLISLNARELVLGDSMSYASGGAFGSGPFTWNIPALSGMLRTPQTANIGGTSSVGGNMAIAGASTTTYLGGSGSARQNLVLSAVKPGCIITIGGWENNPAQSVSTATAIAEYESFFTAAFAAGAARIFLRPMAPTKAAAYGSSQAYKATIDAWAAAAAAADPRITFMANAWSGVTLALDATTTGPHAYDGTHQNVIGSRLQAVNEAVYKLAYLPSGQSVYDALPTGDIMGTRGDMLGSTTTGANGMGNVPTSWTLTNSTGATVTVDVVPDLLIPGERGVILTISGTVTARSRIRLTTAPSHTPAIGDIFTCAARLAFEAQGGGAPTNLLGIQVGAYSANAKWGAETYASGQGLLSAGGPFNGIVRGVEYAAPTTPTSVGHFLDIQPEVGPITTPIVVKFGRARLWNLTQLGFAA